MNEQINRINEAMNKERDYYKRMRMNVILRDTLQQLENIKTKEEQI